MRKIRETPPSMELCLCRRCASVYYENSDYFISRSDIGQVVLEACDICMRPHGYDFKIWNLSSLQNEKTHVCGGPKK